MVLKNAGSKKVQERPRERRDLGKKIGVELANL